MANKERSNLPPNIELRLSTRMLARSRRLAAVAASPSEKRLALLTYLSGHLIQLRAMGANVDKSPFPDLFRSLADLDSGHVDPTLQPGPRSGKSWRQRDFENDVLSASAMLEAAGVSRRQADAEIFSELKDTAAALGLQWTINTIRNLRQAQRINVDPISATGRLIDEVRYRYLLAKPDEGKVGASRSSSVQRNSTAAAAVQARKIIAVWKSKRIT